MFINKHHTQKAVSLALLLMGGIFFTSCSGASNASSSESAAADMTLDQAVTDHIDKVLPTQETIHAQKSFPYLMASPTTEHFVAHEWVKSTTRIPATQAERRSDNTAAVKAVNEQCTIYEQTGLGLFTTENTTFQTVNGERRRIAIGQNGIDQITGYSSIFSTPDRQAATNMIADFKSHTADCDAALQNLFPGVNDHYLLSPVTVKGSTGSVSLHGIYNGDSFVLTVTQVDNYLVTTWFRTLGKNSDDVLLEATETIHKLASENAQAFGGSHDGTP